MSIEPITRNLVHETLSTRLLTAGILFFALFFALTVLSYFFLPQEFLLSKNALLDWETPDDLLAATLQIFSYNLLSVGIFVLANLFACANRDEGFIPYGYLGLGIQFAINAVTLGTWSFTVAGVAPDLPGRVLRMCDLAHRAGLWEMVGQMAIVCATARIAIVKTKGKEVVSRPFREIHLSKPELVLVALGLGLMIVGALVESNSILLSMG